MVTSMLSRAVWKFLTLILLAGLILHPDLAQAGKSYQADNYDVLLELQPGGWMLVTETVTFDFSGGPFTYVFRDIIPVETDGIEILQAKMDDQTLPQGKSPGQVELHPGNPYQIRWHFQPVSDETHTFELVYRVQGVIRKSDNGQDMLLWRAIPQEHDYPILSSKITIQYPQTAQLVEQPDLVSLPSQPEAGLHRYTLSTENIQANHEVMVEARFQPGSLASAPPRWQAHQAEVKRRTVEVLPLGILVFIVVLAGGILFLRWRVPGAFASNWLPAVYPRVGTPPGSLAPAPAAWLVSASSSPGGVLPLVTLFDLARRGAVKIEELPQKRWRGRDYLIEKQDLRQPWLPHEQDVLRFLFENRPAGQEQLRLSELSQALPGYHRKFEEILLMELQSANLLDPERKITRDRLGKVGVIELLSGVGLGVISAMTASLASHGELWPVFTLAASGLAAGAALFALGLAWLFTASHYSIWTEAGNRLADQWRGYESFLRDVTKGLAPASDPRLFDQGLPYAFGFGIGNAWVKAFQKQDGIEIPAWFQSVGTAIQDEITSMAYFVSVADGYAGDSGGGGGGGGSGGGASGAG